MCTLRCQAAYSFHDCEAQAQPLKALSVIPGVVRLRIALIVAAALALTLSPWALFSAWPVRAAAAQLGLSLLGLYVGWCFWPRLCFFIAPADRAQLSAQPEELVHLTVDDGPTPNVTDVLLDLLRQQNLRASFFVLLPKARTHPLLIRRIVTDGHILGLHGEDHRAPFFRSPTELRDSLGRARRELEAIAGIPITLYRPSHGWKTLSLLRAVRAAGLRLCFWDYGIWDTDAPPTEVLLRRLSTLTPLCRSQKRRPVILVHDGRGDAPEVPAHAAPLLAALRSWLPKVHDRAEPDTRPDTRTNTRPDARPDTRLAAPVQKSTRRLPSALLHLGGLGLLIWFCVSIDYAGFRAALIGISGSAIVALLLLATLSTICQGLRFYLLCPAAQGPLRHIWLNFALHAANILLPLRSGEVVRPFYLKRFSPQTSLGALFAWSVADKFIEILTFLPLIALTAWIYFADSRLGPLRAWAWPTLIAGLLGGAVLCLLQLRKSLQRKRGGIRRATLPLALLLSVLMWLANYLMFYLVVPDRKLALALLVGINAALVIPGPPGGLGTYEAAFLWVGQLGHRPPNTLLAAALVSHLIQYIVTLAIGLPAMLRWGWPQGTQAAPPQQGGIHFFRAASYHSSVLARPSRNETCAK